MYLCFYWKEKSDLKYVVNTLNELNALNSTVVVAASASDPAPLIYMSPFSGLSIAEYFRDRGREVVIVFDDLTTHSKFYRETSLITRRTPGRQSYPGDIFHLHARMVERAGNFKMQNGKTVPITLLPIAETLEGDLAGYIQTNLMAMTDGHVFFDVAEAKKVVTQLFPSPCRFHVLVIKQKPPWRENFHDKLRKS